MVEETANAEGDDDDDDLLLQMPNFEVNLFADKMTAPSQWENCPNGPNYETKDGKKYLLTSLEPACPPMSWTEALDFCQKYANMQAVAFQEGKKTSRIQAILGLAAKPDTGMTSFWTSGYIRHTSGIG